MKQNDSSTTVGKSREWAARRQKKFPPFTGQPVHELRGNDVLLGRGNGVAHFIGNKRFRSLVNQYKGKYAVAERSEKQSIAKDVVQAIISKGGRFLEVLRDNNTNDSDRSKTKKKKKKTKKNSTNSAKDTKDADNSNDNDSNYDDDDDDDEEDDDEEDGKGKSGLYRTVSPERAVEKTCQALREKKCELYLCVDKKEQEDYDEDDDENEDATQEQVSSTKNTGTKQPFCSGATWSSISDDDRHPKPNKRDASRGPLKKRKTAENTTNELETDDTINDNNEVQQEKVPMEIRTEAKKKAKLQPKKENKPSKRGKRSKVASSLQGIEPSEDTSTLHKNSRADQGVPGKKKKAPLCQSRGHQRTNRPAKKTAKTTNHTVAVPDSATKQNHQAQEPVSVGIGILADEASIRLDAKKKQPIFSPMTTRGKSLEVLAAERMKRLNVSHPSGRDNHPFKRWTRNSLNSRLDNEVVKGADAPSSATKAKTLPTSGIDDTVLACVPPEFESFYSGAFLQNGGACSNKFSPSKSLPPFATRGKVLPWSTTSSPMRRTTAAEATGSTPLPINAATDPLFPPLLRSLLSDKFDKERKEWSHKMDMTNDSHDSKPSAPQLHRRETGEDWVVPLQLASYLSDYYTQKCNVDGDAAAASGATNTVGPNNSEEIPADLFPTALSYFFSGFWSDSKMDPPATTAVAAATTCQTVTPELTTRSTVQCMCRCGHVCGEPVAVTAHPGAAPPVAPALAPVPADTAPAPAPAPTPSPTNWMFFRSLSGRINRYYRDGSGAAADMASFPAGENRTIANMTGNVTASLSSCSSTFLNESMDPTTMSSTHHSEMLPPNAQPPRLKRTYSLIDDDDDEEEEDHDACQQGKTETTFFPSRSGKPSVLEMWQKQRNNM